MMMMTDADTDRIRRKAHESAANTAIRWLACSMTNPGSWADTKDEFLRRFPDDPNRPMIEAAINLHFKAGVDPMTTTQVGGGASLATSRINSGIVDLSRPETLVGRLPLPRVPANVTIPALTTDGSFDWWQEAGVISATNLSLASISVAMSKFGGIMVLAQELVRLSIPSAINVVRNAMVAGLSKRLDRAFLDPASGAAAGRSGSVTSTGDGFGSAGTSSANALTDIEKLFTRFFAVNQSAARAAFICSPSNAAAIARATGWQQLTIAGGNLWGVPAYPTAAAEGQIVLLDPDAILLADDDGIDVSISTQAGAELSTAATSPPTSGTVYVGFWQSGLVGIRVMRYLAWKVARSSAVHYTTQVYV